MKLATTTSDFSAYTTNSIKAMEYIAQAGFRYIDYNFCVDYNHKTGFFGTDDSHLNKVKEKASELGVSFVQAHAPFYSFIFDGDIVPLIEATIRCVKACAALEIPVLVVHTGYQRNISKEENFQKNKVFFTPILEAGKQYGVKILAENFNKMEFSDIYWIDNATDLKEFIDFMDHPNLFAVWDAGHANLQEMSQKEELEKLGDKVLALHIHDNFGNDDQHVPPFYGTMSPDSLMEGLLSIGYRGYFTFEAENVFFRWNHRRVGEAEPKLQMPPLSLRIQAEAFLYQIGKTILEAYDCFEE